MRVFQSEEKGQGRGVSPHTRPPFCKKVEQKLFLTKAFHAFVSRFLKVQKTFCKKFSGGVWGNAPRCLLIFLQ